MLMKLWKKRIFYISNRLKGIDIAEKYLIRFDLVGVW
jgi:hypothetical protein